MNITFSFKLFLAFIVFGMILFFSSFFLSYTVFDKKFHKESINTFSKLVDEKNEDLQELISHHKFLIKKISLDKDLKFDTLSTMLLSNKELLQISIIKNNSSKEYIKIKKKNGEIVNESLYFDHIESFDIFPDILNLKKQKAYNSSIKLNKENAEIKNPLEAIIYFVIKGEKDTIITKVNVNKILESLKFSSYIIDRDNYIIYDKNKANSWSRYFNPNLELNDVIKSFASYLLKNDMAITNSYYFKRVDIDGERYLNIILDNESITFEQFLDKYRLSIFAIAYISFIIALILALVFTTPLSNINKKLLTEKDILNDSMKENKSKLDNTLELINQYVMYLKVDKDWNILDVSDYLCKVSGYQKEELLGHNYKIMLHSNSYEKFIDVKNYLEEKKLWTGEFLCAKKMGIDYWVSSRVEANYDENSKIISYTEVRTDIDDRKRLEALYNDLNYQIEQLNVIFQNANSGIALIDVDGGFKRFNQAFINIFQYQESELIKKNFFDLADSASENILLEVIKQLDDFNSISNMELIFLTKNSEEVYLDLSLRYLRDKENIVLVINSLEDKRKLQELNLNLEQRVSDEVKKNIEKDKLHQEQQIKNAKLTSIGTLAAGITHEINTPLTYLKGNFEILQMDLEDSPEFDLKKDMLEGCEKIDEAINRIAVIVESMREMSQSSSEAKEKSNIYSTLITSLTMAYNVSKQISRIYLNDELFVITSIDKNKFEFLSNVQKQRIEQVWIIIINNALDELKKIEDYEKREFSISVYEKGDEVIVKFKDNAGGIKEDIINKIFDPFVSTKQHSGMGVGLNIAKKIVDEQEGQIVAYNEGEGAVFEVRLKKIID